MHNLTSKTCPKLRLPSQHLQMLCPDLFLDSPHLHARLYIFTCTISDASIVPAQSDFINIPLKEDSVLTPCLGKPVELFCLPKPGVPIIPVLMATACLQYSPCRCGVRIFPPVLEAFPDSYLIHSTLHNGSVTQCFV